MPELPDIEVYKRYLDSKVIGKKISAVEANEPRFLRGVNPTVMKKTLIGQHFRKVHRHGKYLFARVTSHTYLVMHFGLTGFLVYNGKDESRPRMLDFLFSLKTGQSYLSLLRG
jgi:formamidopyrimidine-DNA glycosylase